MFLVIYLLTCHLFKVHKAMGQVWAEMARHLSDSLILPFNVSDYAFVMDNMAKTLLKDFGSLMDSKGIETGKHNLQYLK